MKKYIVLVMIAIFAIGCGPKKEARYEGAEKNDYIEDGMEFLAESDLPRAIQSFDHAIQSDPMNPKNYLILGQVYLRLKEFTRAIDSFSGAIKVSPDNGEAYYFLATAKMLNGDKKGAVEAAQQSVEIFMNDRDEERFKKSVVLLKSLVDDPGEKVAQDVQEAVEKNTETVQ